MKKRVRVDLRVDQKTVEWIDQIAALGLLGSTREKVLIHMIRQHIFEQEVYGPRKDSSISQRSA